MIYDHHYHPSVFGLLDLSPGPSLPVDYITDYAGGPIFALARSSKVEPGPPKLGPLMKLRKFDRCALEAIIAYRSYSRCLELEGSKAQFMGMQGLMQGVFPKTFRKKPNKFYCYLYLTLSSTIDNES